MAKLLQLQPLKVKPAPIPIGTKKSKNSMPSETLAKNQNWQEFLKPAAFRFFPEKNDWRGRLIFSLYDFMDWRDEKGRKPLDVGQFFEYYRIPYSTFMEWYHKYPDLKEAYDNFKMFLGCTRRVGAYYKELDKDAVWKDQHRYDPEWDEVNKYHAALKTDQAANETKVVVIERMPSTDKVPEKK